MRLCNSYANNLHNYSLFMLKEKRQNEILNLIGGKQIATQEELSGLLENKGFSVTQSSVSRDLLELGIVKARGFYAVPQTSQNAAATGFLRLEVAGANLIVAECESGLASAIAVRIDTAKISEIVGTIAGDDTIFIAVKDRRKQKVVLKKIWEIFGK